MIFARRLFLSALLCAACALPGLSPAFSSEDIDALLAAEWAGAGVEPAGIADDSQYLRRLSLDLRGVIPTIDETVAFLADESPDKHARIAEEWLASPERSEHWAAYWDKVLVGTLDQPVNPVAQIRLKSHFREWVAAEFDANTPYDDFFRAIVTAHGDLREEGAVLPLARWRDAPEDMAGSISRAFLGQQIQCAQCHDHKDDETLTQKRFWEFAAFFDATKVRPVRYENGNGYESILVEDAPGRFQTAVPDTELVVSPKYLDGSPATRRIVGEDGVALDRREIAAAGRRMRELREERDAMMEAGADPSMRMQLAGEVPNIRDTRRDELQRLMLAGDNRQIARNFANRVWARYFGRGFLEPVDAWGTGMEPAMPEVLEALTDEFIAGGWDVRHLERLILGTRAYRLDSMPTESGARYPDLFAHAGVRPLSPEQVLDSIVRATFVETGSGGNDRLRELIRDRYVGQFIMTFDNDEMEWVNAFETSIPRALFLLNDPGVNQAVSARPDSVLDRIDRSAESPADAVDLLYLATLSRHPSEEEREFVVAMLNGAKNDAGLRAASEDVLWGLVNSTEFITNH